MENPYSTKALAKARLIRELEKESQKRERSRQTAQNVKEVRKVARKFHQAPYNPCEGTVMI